MVLENNELAHTTLYSGVSFIIHHQEFTIAIVQLTMEPRSCHTAISSRCVLLFKLLMCDFIMIKYCRRLSFATQSSVRAQLRWHERKHSFQNSLALFLSTVSHVYPMGGNTFDWLYLLGRVQHQSFSFSLYLNPAINIYCRRIYWKIGALNVVLQIYWTNYK